MNFKTYEFDNHSHSLKNKDLLFIHNPKVAGNSIVKCLELKSSEKVSTSHKTPTFLVPAKIWESMKTVVGIRHPIDRLVSSYHYHTKPNYMGYFLKRYPHLHEMTLEAYFNCFKKVPYVIMPQYYYTRHFLSDKPVDYLIRFENLEEDLKLMSQDLSLSFKGVPHLNASQRPKLGLFNCQSLKDRILKYYEKDFETFNYQPDFDKY